MTWRTTLWTLAVLLASTAVGFLLFQRQLTGSWLAFGVHPDVLAALDSALEDQKRLAELDPERRAEYHRRFEALETLHNRLRILDHSREGLMSRYGALVLALFGAIVLVAGTVSFTRQRRDEARLERLRGALAALSAGRTDLAVGETSGDVIGRVAVMVEETSQVMARDRRRLEQLENLAAWQEAARRHAHEMRTPLTAARLELERVRDLSREAGRSETEPRAAAAREITPRETTPREITPRETTPQEAATANPLEQAALNVARELDRLAEFTRGFADFARLPRPRTERWELRELATGFAKTFADAWPGTELILPPRDTDGAIPVEADRDLLVQVLVNLADNAVQAGATRIELVPGREGRGAPWLEVRDDGPGVPKALRERLFDPYVTGKPAGEGMGLGLAISKKILLDHGGDLELRAPCQRSDLAGSSTGAVFRLTFPPLETPS